MARRKVRRDHVDVTGSRILERHEVEALVSARLPEVWRRAEAVPDLRHRIVEVLREPANGDLATQLATLVALFSQAASLSEVEWVAWAKYAFPPIPMSSGSAEG